MHTKMGSSERSNKLRDFSCVCAPFSMKHYFYVVLFVHGAQSIGQNRFSITLDECLYYVPAHSHTSSSSTNTTLSWRLVSHADLDTL